MEINKLTFENLKDLAITQSFEELDVNNDGVINEYDKSLAKSSELANVINNLLNNVDEESELVNIANETKTSSSKNHEKAAATKNSTSVPSTDSTNFENDVTNSKGTVYVVMGNLSGCGYCVTLNNKIKQNLSELEAVASIYNLDWNKNNNLCWSIYNQAGNSSGGVTFPQIAKFVDGKFVELIDNPRNASAAVKSMIEKAEGSKSTDETEETDSSKETNTNSTSGLTDEEKAKLAELKEELAALNAQISEINETIAALKKANEELEAKRAEYEEEQKTAQEEADKANEKLEQEQATLDTLTKEYDNYQTEIDEVNQEILKEQGREEEEYKDSMTNLVNKAINNYDPTTDGDDFDAYFTKKMDDAGFPTFSKLNDLNSHVQNLSSNAADLLSNIKMQSSIVSLAKRAADAANSNLTAITTKLNSTIEEINSNNTKIQSLNTDLSAKESKKSEVQTEINEIVPPVPGSGLTAAEVLSKISEKEKCFAKELGWNLEDCIIALGQDNNFHIYNKAGENGLDSSYYTSSTRAYYKKTAGNFYAEGSYDTTPCGSGFLSNNIQEFDDSSSEGRAIYRFNSVNDDWTDGCVCESRGCYQTCSPLSFDVAGDGINTTNETVSFDIDGDGELDTVNNSDEWVLAFDKDGNGKAGENGSELFGDNTDLDGDGKADGYKNGFEALKVLAKKEGLIGENDTKLDEADIKLLSEKYGLVMTKGYAGEAKSLSDIGITEINLATTDETKLTKNFDGRNNDIMTQEGATFVVNGETREYADIWNAKKDTSEAVNEADQLKFYNTVTARIADTKVRLGLNKHGVVALEGNVDFENIKNSSMNKSEAPNNIFEEVIEVKDEEEIEE